MRRSRAGGKSATFTGVIGTNEKWLESIADFPTTSFFLCLHVISMTGVAYSLLVLSGKSSYANCVMQQCLACAYRNRTQSTMCPECSVRLICNISVSALLLPLMNYRKIGCKSTLFHPIRQTFFNLFLGLNCLYTTCIKKIPIHPQTALEKLRSVYEYRECNLQAGQDDVNR